MRGLAAIALLCVLLSACAEAPKDAPAVRSADPDPAAPAQFDETSGGLDGLVHTEELLPVVDANVRLPDLQRVTTTDRDGRFSFSNVAPGEWQLLVEKPGYGLSQRVVRIEAGAAASADILLGALPHAEAYYRTQEQEGLIGCTIGMTGLIGLWFPACWLENPVIYPSQFDRNPLKWRLPGDPTKWSGFAHEMEWTSTQTLGKTLGFRVDIVGCHATFGGALTFKEGPSPLRNHMNSTQLSENLTNKTARSCVDWTTTCPANQCPISSQADPHADNLGPGSPVDAAIIFQQPFRHVLTDFFYFDPPPDFTALADG